MNTPNRLTVFWLCSQCGARGQVEVPCPNAANLEQQLTAIRAAYYQIDHQHPDKVSIGHDRDRPFRTDAGEWIN